MLKHASKRKEEQERAYNRMQRRRADEEAAEYGDTEKFVTPAYKAQLIQEAQIEKRERQEEEDERKAVGQGSIGSFLANVVNGANASASSEGAHIEQPPGASARPTLNTAISASESAKTTSVSGNPPVPAPPVPVTALPSEPSPEEVAFTQYQAQLAADRAETAEKVAAARARYLIRKAQRE